MGERERKFIFGLADRTAKHGDPLARRTIPRLAAVVAGCVVVSGLIAAVVAATDAWSVRFSSPTQGAVIAFGAILVGLTIGVVVPWWRGQRLPDADEYVNNGSGKSGREDPTPREV